jgi:putative ABC transport system ATP-binding protein
MSDERPALLGQHLTRAFGSGHARTVAVREVSLTVARGEIALIMGPSGSGKSTLLAMLSGLLHPDAGRVLALGHDLWNLAEGERKEFRRRYCGFVFQGYNLFPALNARQQLEVVLRWGQNRSGREAERVADAMLDRLGLARQRLLRPDQLSGGEKQRVAIGRALVKTPALCFADEPTSALDWTNGRSVIELLRTAAHHHGTGVLIISHDARVLPYVDRTFYLEDGELTDAPAGEHPKTEEVRDGSGI